MTANVERDPKTEFKIIESTEAGTPSRIFLPRSFTEENLLTIGNRLVEIEAKNPASVVEMIISTTGGKMGGTTELITKMRHCDLRFRTIARNLCQSAGVFVLAAGTPGERCADEDVDFLFHPLRYNINARKTASEWAVFAQQQQLDEDRHLKRLANLTKLTVPRIKELFPDDVHFTAKQALEYGIIDTILPVSK